MKVFWQYLFPQHFLSLLLGRIAGARQVWLKNFLIKIFCRYYRVDLSEAEKSDYRDYENFQQFFARALKPGVRPLAQAGNAIISPVDGKISQIGKIVQGKILQAKHFDFTLLSLLAGRSDLAAIWQDGSFATIYLAPHNYHRIHMPCFGKLLEMIYVPGDLFAVNHVTAQGIANLFARNERVICVFETSFGKMAVILVGALIVGSISTTWAGVVAPPHGKAIVSTSYADQKIELERGAELGAFHLGSTVIILFPKDQATWQPTAVNGAAFQMGQLLGSA